MPPVTRPKNLALATLGLVGTLLIQTPLQSIQAVEPTPSDDAIASVDLPFNPETDYPTQRPANREQTRKPYDDGRYVIGADERQPLLNRSFPWSAIGRLELQDASGNTQTTCTGTLISSDLVLTNAHCLQQTYRDPETGQAFNTFISTERYQQQRQTGAAPTLVFKPIMIEGVSLDEASVVSYQAGWTEGGTNAPADDWAIIKLDTALGNDYGSLGWHDLDFNDSVVTSQLAEKVLFVGYSADFPTPNRNEFGAPGTTAGMDEYCSIVGTFREGIYANTFIHDCDMTPGSSGGPVLAYFTDGSFYIVGLNAYQIALEAPYTFPDGTTMRATNAGVQPSRWTQTASEMVTP